MWYTWFSGCISSTCKTNTWEVHDLTKPVLHHQNEHVLWYKDPYFFAWIFHRPTIFQPINFLPHLHGCKAHRHPKAATWPRWSGGKTHLGVMCSAGWTALGMYPGGRSSLYDTKPKECTKRREISQNYLPYMFCFWFDPPPMWVFWVLPTKSALWVFQTGVGKESQRNKDNKS